MKLEKQDVFIEVDKRSEECGLEQLHLPNGVRRLFKPVKDVYVLTESEMIKLIDTAMRPNSLTAQYFLEEEI